MSASKRVTQGRGSPLPNLSDEDKVIIPTTSLKPQVWIWQVLLHMKPSCIGWSTRGVGSHTNVFYAAMRDSQSPCEQCSLPLPAHIEQLPLTEVPILVPQQFQQRHSFCSDGRFQRGLRIGRPQRRMQPWQDRTRLLRGRELCGLNRSRK